MGNSQGVYQDFMDYRNEPNQRSTRKSNHTRIERGTSVSPAITPTRTRIEDIQERNRLKRMFSDDGFDDIDLTTLNHAANY